jgi:NADH:ubiquinone oxidoreductase subunit 4 (subunit M)
VLVLISVLGIVITAAFLLYAMQRVFLGKLNPKYARLSGHDPREVFCQAPFLFLCVASASSRLPDRLDERLDRTVGAPMVVEGT